MQALLFNTTCAVYTPDPTTKRYTVQQTSGLPCRLAHNPTGTGAPLPERAELMQSRRLIWPPDYVMPDYAEVEVGGDRWRPIGGTFGKFVEEWPTYRVALVVKRAA
jgi:hypothetical protein